MSWLVLVLGLALGAVTLFVFVAVLLPILMAISEDSPPALLAAALISIFPAAFWSALGVRSWLLRLYGFQAKGLNAQQLIAAALFGFIALSWLLMLYIAAAFMPK